MLLFLSHLHAAADLHLVEKSLVGWPGEFFLKIIPRKDKFNGRKFMKFPLVSLIFTVEYKNEDGDKKIRTSFK